jgi:hypothetical protein
MNSLEQTVPEDRQVRCEGSGMIVEITPRGPSRPDFGLEWGREHLRPFSLGCLLRDRWRASHETRVSQETLAA